MKTLKSWTAKQYLANLNPVVVKHEVGDTSGISMADISISVLVNTSKGKNAMGFWIDVNEIGGGELVCDWLQYIFDLTNDNECKRKEMQDNSEFFEKMASVAREYVEKRGFGNLLKNETFK